MKNYRCTAVAFSSCVLLVVAPGLSACSRSSLHIPTADGSAFAPNAADGESPGPAGSPQADTAMSDPPPVGVVVDAAQSNQSPDVVQPDQDANPGIDADVGGQGDGSGGQSPSYCTIGGNEYESNGINPTNPCQICNPQASASAWSSRDGVACDDGLFCTGVDTCSGGTCSRHAGSPCVDNGLFCDGVESCDEATRHCVSSGNPCPDDGNPCNGPETCSESTKQCQHKGLPNDCGTSVCGASPTGCFTCGVCSADQICARGRCGCTPSVSTAPAVSPPPIPSGLKVECLANPDDLTVAAECPVVRCGTTTYWALSLIDNTDSMTIVGYDAGGNVVHQNRVSGARYIYKIEVDSTAQTITLIGQSSETVVMPWSDLWQ